MPHSAPRWTWYPPTTLPLCTPCAAVARHAAPSVNGTAPKRAASGKSCNEHRYSLRWRSHETAIHGHPQWQSDAPTCALAARTWKGLQGIAAREEGAGIRRHELLAPAGEVLPRSGPPARDPLVRRGIDGPPE